jgi:nitrite reductase/ring-hydroxylating ferredoxin subunit
MLKAEYNELLTQTGPGTPTGDLFRHYWVPALHAEELPEDDCPPVRVKILSERLIAFRDSDGRYGLIDEFCAHRGVSLWFGRVEECGIRCAYHGWKYDVNGQCLEVPSELEHNNFARKVKLTSYPLVKVGDVLWTYMGDPEKQPELPEFEFAQVPPEQTYTSNGVLIVFLALQLLHRWRRGAYHFHVHEHDGVRHTHVQGHAETPLHTHAHPGRSPLAAFLVGCVHGMGGSAAVGILLVAGVPGRGAAVAALILFATGTAISMAACSAAFGLLITATPIRRRFVVTTPVLGALSLLFGVWYGLGAWSVVPYPL